VRPRLIVLLAALFAFLPLATDGFLPAMRPLMAELGVGVGTAQLTISITLAGFAIAQLLVGTVADRVGRRPVLILSIALYAFASLGVSAAPSLAALLVFRFLQGFAAASGPVLMRAIVRDLCDRAEGARVLSLVGMGLGAVPLFVPLINSWVSVRFGWRATQLVPFAYLLLTLWMVFAWYRETLATPDPRATSPTELGRTMRTVLTHPQALGNILCCVFGYAGLAVWISSAPHLLHEYFRQPPETFGIWWAIPAISYAAGGFLSARGLARYPIDAMQRAGAAVLLVGGGALLLMLLLPRMPLAAFIGAVSIYNTGWAIVQPPAQAGALAFFPHQAGRVSAVLGFLQMLAARRSG